MLACRPYPLIFLCFEKYRYLTPSFDRPGFQRMIADIEKGRINLVITKDLSRLGRNYIMCGQYTEIYFPERHVRYIALNDGVDTLNQTSSMDITPFKHILNDMYAKDISTKIKSTLHTKARRGEYLGALDPYPDTILSATPDFPVPTGCCSTSFCHHPVSFLKIG